ncbi:MAG TPA: hypothetical protein VLS27_08995, partial [Gammaproteobacteria bacterium]|nr:hypothetical protein [Gammaproteobacteria bacterium]
MDSLRITLLICGIVLLGGIYVWGVTIARRGARSKKPDDSDPGIEDEIELLERVQDSRAAQNAGSLKELDEFDIDAELEQATAVDEAPDTDSSCDEYDAFEAEREVDRDEARFRPVFAEEVGEGAAADDALKEKTDLVASLSEIRATL